MIHDTPQADATAAPAAVLELDGIHHRFGNLIALDDASLRVAAGRVHGVIGENAPASLR